MESQDNPPNIQNSSLDHYSLNIIYSIYDKIGKRQQEFEKKIVNRTQNLEMRMDKICKEVSLIRECIQNGNKPPDPDEDIFMDNIQKCYYEIQEQMRDTKQLYYDLEQKYEQFFRKPLTSEERESATLVELQRVLEAAKFPLAPNQSRIFLKIQDVYKKKFKQLYTEGIRDAISQWDFLNSCPKLKEDQQKEEEKYIFCLQNFQKDLNVIGQKVKQDLKELKDLRKLKYLNSIQLEPTEEKKETRNKESFKISKNKKSITAEKKDNIVSWRNQENTRNQSRDEQIQNSVQSESEGEQYAEEEEVEKDYDNDE